MLWIWHQQSAFDGENIQQRSISWLLSKSWLHGHDQSQLALAICSFLAGKAKPFTAAYEARCCPSATMKFGHDFKQSLADQGFPPHWVESAVPYRELKKCIKKVERELTSLGLDAEKLRNLVNSSPDPQVLPSQPGQKEVAFQYIFKGMKFNFLDCFIMLEI